MPDDRLLHPRIGDSEKVAKLTDMEFRVWIAYLLAANDYGVMPMQASKIQAVDRTLANRRRVQVDRALVTMVDVGIVNCFEHQGQLFLYTPKWQNYQRIRHPRRSHLPRPSQNDLDLCDDATRELFAQHDGPEAATTYGENIGNISPESVLARTRARETANANGNGDRLTADGKARERFERWWLEYPKKVGKDAAWREWLKRSPSDDLTNQMIAKVREQRTSRDWLKDGGQYIPHPRTWIHQGRWQDETVGSVPSLQAPDWYGHIPHCRNEQECVKRFLEESKGAAS